MNIQINKMFGHLIGRVKNDIIKCSDKTVCLNTEDFQMFCFSCGVDIFTLNKIKIMITLDDDIMIVYVRNYSIQLLNSFRFRLTA